MCKLEAADTTCRVPTPRPAGILWWSPPGAPRRTHPATVQTSPLKGLFGDVEVHRERFSHLPPEAKAVRLPYSGVKQAEARSDPPGNPVRLFE